MIPGEIFSAPGTVTLNAGIPAITVMVANTGDRPVQVGSHYHFAETNPALEFDRAAAQGMRLDIASGTAVRFEPGQRREVNLIPVGGARRIFGFNGKVMGPLALILALSFPQTSEAQTAAECAEPMTQQLMNACAAKEYAEADAALNDAWKPAFARAKEIDQGDALLAAQRAWITYRDLACEVHSSPMAGGSMRPLMQYICLDELTENRTKLLQEFLVY